MVRIRSVPVRDVIEEKRLNPKFFYFNEKRKFLLENNETKYITLDNKEYISLLTDGIHTAVNLSKEGSIKYLYVKNINEGFIDITDNIYLDKEDCKKNNKKILKEKDILLTVVGTLGETAMFSSYAGEIVSLPRNIAFIRTNEEKLLPEFLVSFFLSRFSKEQSIYCGGGNIQGLLSLTKLKKFIIPVPDLEIQKKFKKLYIEALDCQKIILDSIEDLKRTLYEYLYLDKMPENNKLIFSVEVKELEENKIWTPNLFNKEIEEYLEKLDTKEFFIKELNEICESILKGDEVGSENYKNYLEKTENDIPFIRTSDIYNYEINSFPSFYVNKEMKEELNQNFETGDIIINNDGRIGYISMISKKDNCIFQSHIKCLKLKKEYQKYKNLIFGILLLEELGKKQFIKNTVVQTTIPTLANRLDKFKIPLIIDEKKIEKINKIVGVYVNNIEKKSFLLRKIKNEMNNFVNYKST